MDDGRKYNIRDHARRLLCPACGFPDYAQFEAYDERGGIIGTALCPCCLWEPGFDDEQLASERPEVTVLESLRAYRENWRNDLFWRGRDNLRPPDWDGATQVDRLLEIAPHVR